MNLLKIIVPVAKLLPFTQPESKPKTSGEIYYLWESLSSGYKIIFILETYQMNTEDAELHFLLGATINSIFKYRIEPMERTLKREGFTVPPQPGSKRFQGKPGVGQEVKLSDDEIIRSVISWAQFGLSNDARAVGVASSEELRKTFNDLLFEDMKSYSTFLDLGNSRHVLYPPPSATSAKDSLNIDEVARLWEELGARHLTITNLETYYMNTDDKELNKLLLRIINEIAYPQMKQLEDILKKESFTVPPRPAKRLKQGTAGRVTRIIISDQEIISELTLGAQVAISTHIKSYSVALRKDIRELFKNFITTEIKEYDRIMDLASNRHALENPPLTTSHRG